MTLIKDVNEVKKTVQVTYSTEVMCKEVNIVHYNQMGTNCSFLRVAALETRSDETGSIRTGNPCSYEVPCDDGNVTCKVEFVITNGSMVFSLCEIEL